MGFNDLLRMMIEKDSSDLFLTTGAPPSMRAQGKLIPLIDKKHPEGMVKKIAYQIMSDDQIKEVMEKSEQQGMKTFDSALFDLYMQGKISYEETLKNADSKNNVRLRIQLSEGKAGEEEEELEEEDDSGGLSLVGKDDEEPLSF